MRPIVLSLILTVTGCVHDVYDLTAEERVEDAVRSALAMNANGVSYELDDCWRETPDLTFCRVTFAFTASFSQESFLRATSQDLGRQGYQVGFCGQDSFGTQMTSALLVGVASGIVVGAVGGDSGDAAVVAGVASSGHRGTSTSPARLSESPCDRVLREMQGTASHGDATAGDEDYGDVK